MYFFLIFISYDTLEHAIILPRHISIHNYFPVALLKHEDEKKGKKYTFFNLHTDKILYYNPCISNNLLYSEFKK